MLKQSQQQTAKDTGHLDKFRTSQSWLKRFIAVAMRGRPKIGGGTQQNAEIQMSGLFNTITSVQKDNLVIICRTLDKQQNKE